MIHAAAFARAPLRPMFLGLLHPATRLAWLFMVIALAMVSPWPLSTALLLLGTVSLALTGLGLRAQASLLRPWLPIVALVVAVHVLTTTSAAPLGHPSWEGLGAGARALTRLAVSVVALTLYTRTGSLDDLTSGVGWWLQPLRRTGFSAEDFGLTLAVACGTVSQVVGEGRRLQIVGRLRRRAPPGFAHGRRRGPMARLVDRVRIVVPLLETMGRRAESLELALRHRRPAVASGLPVPVREWMGIGAGLLVLATAFFVRWGPWHGV